MQEQQNCTHKTWHIRIEIISRGFHSLTIITKHSILDVAAALDPPLISNGDRKIGFVSLLRKKLFLLFYIMLWYCHFLGRWEKLCREKLKMDPLTRTLSWHFFQLLRVILNFILDTLNIFMTFDLEIAIFVKTSCDS